MNAQRYDVQPNARVFLSRTQAGQTLQQKVDARKAEMGSAFLCHKDNVITKKQEPKHPVAWMVPRLTNGLNGDDVGSVIWELVFNGHDAHSVVDKNGKTFKPRALVYQDEQLYSAQP